ncbi:hypothetical protein IEO21_02059 [Rhodonia placenta]|uniref:Auxin efflux carrier n=1 Tax=Rhodonia placenta TaxID=104341 RepID=A0A8H7U4U4_9APHY|nr:hypothetical protein IEO21_02059 [Postia placenta]
MPSAGYLIYCGIMPLLKTYIGIGIGYFLARRGLFSPEASKGASQISMNVSLPALIFANVVPAFTPSNISALGPLFLTAFTYQIMGFSFGLIIREFFYVPRNFWQGIVVLCANAIVSSIMQEAPFNPDTDPALGVSYVSIFIVSYHLVFWVGGAARSLSWDYRPGIPQGEEAERHYSWMEKPIGGLIARHVLRLRPAMESSVTSDKTDVESDTEKGLEKKADLAGDATDSQDQTPIGDLSYSNDLDIQLARRTSRLSIAPRVPSTQQPAPPPALASAPPQASLPEPARSTFGSRLKHTLQPLTAAVTPITCALALALPIALIDDLKALFVDVRSEGGPAWHGPDGNPPLAFVMDTAEFLGGICVPLSLIILGGSFARLKIPRPLSRLPVTAMVAAMAAKMVILPVIGIFMVQAMVKGRLIEREALAERFVAMFLSGTPAAVNQLIVSSLYSPDGTADTLSVGHFLRSCCEGRR